MGSWLQKTFYHTSLPFSRAKCDICIDFETNEYPNIFPPKNACGGLRIKVLCSGKTVISTE